MLRNQTPRIRPGPANQENARRLPLWGVAAFALLSIVAACSDRSSDPVTPDPERALRVDGPELEAHWPDIYLQRCRLWSDGSTSYNPGDGTWITPCMVGATSTPSPPRIMSQGHPAETVIDFDEPVFSVSVSLAEAGTDPLCPTTPVTWRAYEDSVLVEQGTVQHTCEPVVADTFHLLEGTYVTRLVITTPAPLNAGAGGISVFITTTYHVDCPPQPLTGDLILDMPETLTMLDQIWTLSHPSSPAFDRIERVGYVLEHKTTGELMIEIAPINPAVDTPCKSFGGVGIGFDWRILVAAHSHPFKPGSSPSTGDLLPSNCGFPQGARYNAFRYGGPSEEDINDRAQPLYGVAALTFSGS